MQIMPASGVRQNSLLRKTAARLVLANDSHRPVDLNTQISAKVRERLWQGWDIGRPSPGLVEEGGNEAVPERSGREHHVSRLDLEFDGACPARAKASLTNSRGTGCCAKTSASNGAL